MIKWRRKRKEASDLYIKQLVKIVMSKTEILQSSKVHREIKVLDQFQKNEIFYNWKMLPYIVPFFRIPR